MSDAYLYLSTGDKCRLKTNLDVHIAHVRDSGVTDAIRLVKFWKVRNGVNLKSFGLELLIIKLPRRKTTSLTMWKWRCGKAVSTSTFSLPNSAGFFRCQARLTRRATTASRAWRPP